MVFAVELEITFPSLQALNFQIEENVEGDLWIENVSGH